MNASKVDLPLSKRIIFTLVVAAVIIPTLIIIGEFAVLILNPQEYMFPRWRFSHHYGKVLPKNTTMHHVVPGQWEFIYSVNEYGYRGPAIPISNDYQKKNIVVLGDSYSFGQGVNDGENYSSVMAQGLSDKYQVINLAVMGWGLTQQIRRYYEFGTLYSPRIVILQFCHNDLGENYYDRVAKVENGRFIFQNTNHPLSPSRQFLLNSPLHKSQLFTIIRRAYQQLHRMEDSAEQVQELHIQEGKLPEQVIFYNRLLETFAEDLNRRGVRLIMIAVNGQLEEFPRIEKKVNALHNQGEMIYLEVVPWFANVSNFESPEGHDWGAKAHLIIGENLTDYIQKNCDSGI